MVDEGLWLACMSCQLRARIAGCRLSLLSKMAAITTGMQWKPYMNTHYGEHPEQPYSLFGFLGMLMKLPVLPPAQGQTGSKPKEVLGDNW